MRLGNNSNMVVIGKGNVLLQINGIMQVITGVFYVLELKKQLDKCGSIIGESACNSYSIWKMQNLSP